ncbi:uncharacterized protein LOC128996685 [Macrosteles quadrilineatus]|uniref:uncharacterized protein LOC128996685 n=1 Tax=Macrosteles quadrilineatus TaxID=74068 RepID=UPI0023E2E3A7|nr:uncharacterized protein LOC128996685 [Macrosteles quadrilineatus]XP_054278094.1 uncharacterized protein LOC128996685 [Macrosteles quadrilineatus]XP_054278095.1 uncharacterized protein LOC128996685 [Macrosteles quadrilineatus]
MYHFLGTHRLAETLRDAAKIDPHAPSTCKMATPEKKYSRNRCSFTGCGRSKASHPKLRFFSFPVTRPAICEMWITNCQNEKLDTCTKKTLNKRVVCEIHFEDDSYLSTLKTRLHACAVPTLLSPIEETPSDNLQTDKECDSVHDGQIGANVEKTPDTHTSQHHIEDEIIASSSPRELFADQTSPKTLQTPLYKKFKSVRGRQETPKKSFSPGESKLAKKLKALQKTNKMYRQRLYRLKNKDKVLTKDDIMDAIKDMLPDKVSKFFCMQLKHAGANKLPWAEEEMQQALAMRYKSPALYEQMRNDGFALPSPSTIQRWLNDQPNHER